MAKATPEEVVPASSKAKRVRVSQGDVPAHPLDEALRVASAIAENYASSPTKPLDVAVALNMSPTSSNFKMLTGAAIAYGLTSGGYNASEISLTPLAKRILAIIYLTYRMEGDRIIGIHRNKADDRSYPRHLQRRKRGSRTFGSLALAE